MVIAFFVRLVRGRSRSVTKLVDENLRAVERGDFCALQPPQPGLGETVESLSITGVYSRLGKEIQKATEEKKRVRSAARRLAETIGVVPPRSPAHAKCK